jgi:hypothetical protein
LELRLPTGSLIHGSSGRIEVVFQLQQAVRGLAVGVGLDNLEGSRTLTLDSDTANPPFNLEAGVYTVSLGLDFWPLHPSSYSCNAALMVGHNYLDAVPNAGIWEVLTDAHDAVTDRGNGAVRPRPNVILTAGQ